MNENTIPTAIVTEADCLSKETGIPFRTCLEVLYRAYLAKEDSYTLQSRPQRGQVGVKGLTR